MKEIPFFSVQPSNRVEDYVRFPHVRAYFKRDHEHQHNCGNKIGPYMEGSYSFAR